MIDNCRFTGPLRRGAYLRLQKYTKIPNVCGVSPYYFINKEKN